MRKAKGIVGLVLLLVFALIVAAPTATQAFDCDNLPWGWWYHPGLWAMCHMLEQFWNCGFDLDCYGWDDGF
jgi:hypothetical protein